MPLIISGGGVGGGRVPQQVRNLDIMPTLTGLARVEDDLPREEVDLLRLLARGDLEDLDAFAEDISPGYEQKAWQDDRYKFIVNHSGKPGQELFDVRSDPRELEDIAGSKPAECDRLDAAIAELLARWEDSAGLPQEVDEATRQRLKALGY